MDISSDGTSDVKAKQKEEAFIKVLGAGCTKCNELENNVREALKELNINDEIEHITDFVQIASYGVMSTPALVLDKKVVCYGKVISKKEVIEILKREYEWL
ncbi:thioredoxin family protein [uncultured Anaerofustis sp.]|nr:thioredoxin family protein [uncultured Anaerofustis sp.]